MLEPRRLRCRAHDATAVWTSTFRSSTSSRKSSQSKTLPLFSDRSFATESTCVLTTHFSRGITSYASPVPEPERAAWRMADLYVRGALWDIYSLNEIRKLRFLATSGDPLAICMGPIAVEASDGWALAPSAGIGCGCVFPPKGNRSAGFPDWCPLCHKARRADRAAISLVRWKNVHDAYSRVGAEGYARELWRPVRLHERRSPQVNVVGGTERPPKGRVR